MKKPTKPKSNPQPSRHWRRRRVPKFLYVSEEEHDYFNEAAKARVRKLNPNTPTRNQTMFQPFIRVAARRYAKKLLGLTLRQFTEKKKKGKE
jgi:acyl-CoA reductase-like NAD-dependent aldehyde dehydrogenase